MLAVLPMHMDPQNHGKIAELVRLSVLGWSAALLTMSYMGWLPKMDPTFIASLLSGTLAGYGITRATKESDQDNGPTVITAKPPARRS